ncbi:hypothetical protein [Streptomyces sp. NRRL F-4489]|uniref:hypothetical protein n=1 Tax=Streptomyces sp. NRRL F-4489 TaxID=1609095 RepID=UPI00083485B5|nr:hypothetical protein [Streptomyces sp. NRRL F-4489]
MAADELARTVREQVGAGRILPLGGPADGAWITERAARAALLRAPGLPPGVRLDALRLSLADPDGTPAPAVPAPPGALPPGPLRLTADVTAPPGRPLPALTGALRTALLTAAEDALGLVVDAADLRVTGLLDAPPGPVPAPGTSSAGTTASPYETVAEPPRGGGASPAPGGADELAARVLAVPGVARLAPATAGRSRGVARSGGHALVQLATAPGYRPLDVARAVRSALTAPAPGPDAITGPDTTAAPDTTTGPDTALVTAAVLVTAVDAA